MEFLKSQKKPDWAACRWIYVNGLDLDVVKSLATSKTLHRLAIEDVLHANSPTKVDWYSDHAFIVLPLQNLIHSRPRGRHVDTTESVGRSGTPSQTANARARPLAHSEYAVSVEQVSVFLTADKTVITVFERSGPAVLDPILTLLESPQTMVRSSNDPSMLVHAVIDTVVDLSLPIGKAFSDAFRDLEQAVLMSPTIAQSRQLYSLRSELTLIRDNIIPIGSVVGMLRDHCDVTQPQPAYADPGTAVPNPHLHPPQPDQSPSSARLISPLTRTYLADVQDHVRVLANSTYSSIRSAENLTSLIFNTITARQNESVRQLTLVSMFFLPLTFLTGYFGMNFDPMPIVNDNSDLMFWWIAGPLMGAVATFVVARALWARMSVHMRMRRRQLRSRRA